MFTEGIRLDLKGFKGSIKTLQLEHNHAVHSRILKRQVRITNFSGIIDIMGAVPIVDFARLLEHPTEDDYLAVAEDVRRACEEHSFMYVVNHGIPSETIESAFSDSLKFFQLPDAVKDEHTIDPTKNFRGYNRQGKEILSSEFSYEIKDTFAMIGAQDHDLESYPDDHLPEFRNSMKRIRYGCHSLAAKLLNLFGKAVRPKDDKCFSRTHQAFKDTNIPNVSILRTHYYPPVGPDVPVNSTRCAPHSDYGTITILFQDSMEGLQVKSSNGEWISASPIPDSIIVLIGDLMHQMSDQKFKATEHRVVIPEEEIRKKAGRQSLGFFAFPDDHTTVYPPKYAVDHVGVAGPLTSREYYWRRLNAIQKRS